MRKILLSIVTLSVATPAAANVPLLGDRAAHWQVFGGQMTDNEWGDLFDDWASVRHRDATMIGGGAGLEWPVGRIGFVGVEAQAIKWFGEQTHWELTAPLYIRTPRPRQVWLPALAYGVGLSYATAPSKTEIARTGSSTGVLAHWFFEIEFGNDESRVRPYLRLHHRSDAWSTFNADTGSNAVLIGLRHGF